MAFEKENMAYIEPSRGKAGIMSYSHPSDSHATIVADAYWNALGDDDKREVVMFIQKQRQTHTTAGVALSAARLAEQPVPCIVAAGGGATEVSVIGLKMSAANVISVA